MKGKKHRSNPPNSLKTALYGNYMFQRLRKKKTRIICQMICSFYCLSILDFPRFDRVCSFVLQLCLRATKGQFLISTIFLAKAPWCSLTWSTNALLILLKCSIIGSGSEQLSAPIFSQVIKTEKRESWLKFFSQSSSVSSRHCL